MTIRKILPFGVLFACGVIAMISPLRSADDPKPDPAGAKPGEPPAPADPDKPPPTFTRIYDVHFLLRRDNDFPLASSSHAAAFTTPANRQSNTNVQAGYDGGAGAGGGGGMLFEGRERLGPTYEEVVDQLIKLIVDTVDPDSWRDAGGTLGSVRELDGSLIITHTAVAHKAIAELLGQFALVRNRTVRMTVDWVLLQPADVEKLLKKGAAPGGDAPREIDPAALEKLAPPLRRYHAELSGGNAQTVHFISGRERTVTVNQTALVGTNVATYIPVIGNAGEGIGLEATPAVDDETHSVLLTVLSTFHDKFEASARMTVRAGVAGTAGTGPDGDRSPEPSGTYQELNGVVQEFRTKARIPLGVPVIVGAMTLEPSAKNAEPLQLVLIVKVQSPD